MTSRSGPRRRDCLGGAALGAGLWGASLVAGCTRELGGAPEQWQGGWVGDIASLGHQWRDGKLSTSQAEAEPGRTDVLIVGAGIAGLAAARALRASGIDDIVVLEPNGSPGGNSRAHRLAGQDCPMGAHYLPVPGAAAPALQEWLLELGLARSRPDGRLLWDERALCHAPQERLWFDGAWHAGLLPPMEPGSDGYRQAQRLSALTAELMRELRFSMPTLATDWNAQLAALDAQTFAHWLDSRGLQDPALRWYLDYCCRDDYGAAASVVSAWAGLQYFCSRHGFHPPGARESDDEADGVLTWPQGNGWLAANLAAGLGDRIRLNCLVTRVEPGRQGVVVDTWRADLQRPQRWQAQHVLLALPLIQGARLLPSGSAALQEALAGQRTAPWLVANLLLSREPVDRPGQPRAWDNVAFGQESLGYVHAQHQSLLSKPRRAPVVITAYRALEPSLRQALLDRPWTAWAEEVVRDLALMHPDLPATVEQVDLARHGHAMSVPVPGRRSNTALATLRQAGALDRRIHWAHADLVGYSVFEEAFSLGDSVGHRVAGLLRGRAPRSSWWRSTSQA